MTAHTMPVGPVGAVDGELETANVGPVGTLIRNGTGELLLIPEEELRQVDRMVDLACKRCGQAFVPRKGKGGKAQRFCSTECRTAFNNANRSAQPNDELGQADDLLAHTKPFPSTPEPGSPAARHLGLDRSSGDFDWTADCVVLPEQCATAIYENQRGDIVIRQEKTWDREEDMYVIVRRENAQRFLDQLCDVMGIGSALP